MAYDERVKVVFRREDLEWFVSFMVDFLNVWAEGLDEDQMVVWERVVGVVDVMRKALSTGKF